MSKKRIPWNKGMINKIKKTCKMCGKIYHIWPSAKKDFYCSRDCYYKSRKGIPTWNIGKKCPQISKALKNRNLGKDNAHWKGGRFKRSDGYILVYKPEHLFSTIQNYVFEHRLVMEKYLRRYLKRSEIVHHINGNPSDNRLKNLKLCANNAEHRKLHKIISH